MIGQGLKILLRYPINLHRVKTKTMLPNLQNLESLPKLYMHSETNNHGNMVD
jgi:hypothetical protein